MSNIPDEVRRFLSKIGTLGGSKTSARKKASSAANGKKGGRPRKVKADILKEEAK